MKGAGYGRLTLGLLVGAVFVWLLVRQVDVQELPRILRAADSRWVVAALLAFSTGYAIRIERWRRMLGPRDLRWLDCAGPLMVGFALNNLLPLRAGDLVRVAAFSQRLRSTRGAIAGTLVLERFLDLACLLAALALATWMFAGTSGLWGPFTVGLSVAAALVVILLLLVPSAWSRPLEQLARAISRRAPGMGDRVHLQLANILTPLRAASEARTMSALLALSALAWAAEGCTFWFTALSLSSLERPAGAWYALPVGTLSTLIPGAPGHVGTFDYFGLAAMTATGNDATQAAAFVVLLHALIWLPPTVAGCAYMAGQQLRPHLSRRP
jgi:uncharacterized protein (TIRG00374 family)